MDRYDNHFIDSCAIIGKLLDFDQQHQCAVKYFNKKFSRHTSKRVELEVKGVLNGIRRELLGFFKWITTQTFRGMPTDDRVFRFLNTYVPYDRKKNYDMLNRFYRRYLSDIRSYLMMNDDTSLNTLRSCAISAIKVAQNNLSHLIYKKHAQQIKCYSTPIEYISQFNYEYGKTMKIINYKPDALILIDSLFIKTNFVGNDMGFITTDGDHIIPNSTDIEKILSGLHIFDMRLVK